jgi:hypothetical protein
MVSLKKVGIMHLQYDTSADASTMLVSADGVLVCLLLLICFSLGDVVREGGNVSSCKKEKQELQRLMWCINERWVRRKNS